MPELTAGCHVLFECLQVFVQNVCNGLWFLLFLTQTDEVFSLGKTPACLYSNNSHPSLAASCGLTSLAEVALGKGQDWKRVTSHSMTKLPPALLGTLQSFRNPKNPTDISFASPILYSWFFLSSLYSHWGCGAIGKQYRKTSKINFGKKISIKELRELGSVKTQFTDK